MISIELEKDCWKCYGTGNYDEWGKPGEKRGTPTMGTTGQTIVFSVPNGCPSCDGTGKSLTDIGEAIIELVKSRLNAVPVPIPPR